MTAPLFEIDDLHVSTPATEAEPGIEIIRISARTGEGCAQWMNWLETASATANSAMAEV